MDAYIGQLLDNRYEILEKIGSGGMANVYRARCHRLNRMVAVKILKDDLRMDADLNRRFYAESQAVAMLSHPNIVNVYDVSTTGDYIVMELIDGITLKQYMEQKRVLNWKEALHFAAQIAKGLQHAHSRGVIHRDIKPQNVMVLKDGSIKVADFGIAEIVSEAMGSEKREAIGSVHYISPEQARGLPADERSDIYSLGVVMYEMLTGVTPFTGQSPLEIARQHLAHRPKLPSEWNPEIPAGLEQITIHAMCPEPENRYERADDLLEDLEELRKDPDVTFTFRGSQSRLKLRAKPQRSAETPETPARGRTRPEPKKSRMPVVFAGILMLLAVAAMIGSLYFFVLRDMLKSTDTGTGSVTVPQLIGQSYDSIDPDQYPDLVLEKGSSVYSETYPAGTIIDQDIKSGNSVQTGSTVVLTVSLGREEKPMPSLVGMPLADAQTALNELDFGLNIRITYEENENYDADTVISSDPESGTALHQGDDISLTVCRQTEQDEDLVQVPALVGLDLKDAEELIEKTGLTEGAVKYVENELAAETVIFQSVTQGELAPKGTVLNLQVSSGPAEEDQTEEPEQTDEETAAEEETPPETAEPDTPPAAKQTTKMTTITLPAGTGPATLSLMCGSQKICDDMIVELSDGNVQVALTGSGTEQIDVYVNGVLAETLTVDFGG